MTWAFGAAAAACVAPPAPYVQSYRTEAADTAGSADHAANFITLTRDQVVWGALKAKISAWSKLNADWDNDDGVPPHPSNVSQLVSIVGQAQRLGLPVPAAFIEGDGEIGVQWKGAEYFASISLLNDGEVVGTLRDFRAGVAEPFAMPVREANLSPLLQSLASLV